MEETDNGSDSGGKKVDTKAGGPEDFQGTLLNRASGGR